MLGWLKRVIIGANRDPFDPKARHGIALIALLAWIGIGADGLSSSVYGPAEAFEALGHASALGPLLAIASAVTVFIIALGYNQVIELFPSGGGGYKVATKLLGPYLGLISGSALLIDYVLTITISVAAGVDALWSLTGGDYAWLKMPVQSFLILFLMVLNIRGMKEPILILAPIFLGFLVTHLALIVCGLAMHAGQLPNLLPNAANAFEGIQYEMGPWLAWLFILKAYTLTAGTYTGIEAVSNNVHILAEPRVRTGKVTMLYMAISLSIAAAGVTIMYQLWAPDHHIPGMTLNAATFKEILLSLFGETPNNDLWSSISLTIVLALEAALLLIAANAGFLGGPSVLANMAADRWAPHAFSQLSTRLVTQNGVITMGGAALLVLWATGGNVSLLVVLYSLNVFITFTLSLLGLVKFWIQNPRFRKGWKRRLVLSIVGFIICFSILIVMIIEKFEEGAWATIMATGGVVFMFAMIRRHYQGVSAKLAEADVLLKGSIHLDETLEPMRPETKDRVAVILVGKSVGVGIHELLSVNRIFPGMFEGFVFVSVGEVDTESFKAEESLEELKKEVGDTLQTLARYCWTQDLKADYAQGYGVDVVAELTKVCEDIRHRYPNAIFFSTKLVFDRDNMILQFLHNQTAIAVQRRLHFKGIPMMVLPMKL